MDELNFNDGAYLIFYCYVKQQSKKDELQNNLLDKCIKELENDLFKDHVKVYMEIVLSLPSISIQKLDECNNEAISLNKLESITAEDFDKSVKRLIQKDYFASIDDLVICLQLIFYLVSGDDEFLVDYILNIVLDPLKLFCDKLLHGDYDWLHLRSCPISDTDLSSSIVMVPEQVTISANTSTETPRSGLHLSSFTSIPQDEGSESMDSATPPEIIEKPPNISASFIKLMTDDVDASIILTKEDTPSIDEPITSSEDSTDSVLTVKDETLTTPTCQQSVVESDDSFLKTYLPHISIGVFAAAACIGIMTLKK